MTANMPEWNRCRACGEEGITTADDRCPRCGVGQPAVICLHCRRPIRQGRPWHLTVEGEPEPRSYHAGCYLAARRRLLSRRLTSEVTFDPEDTVAVVSPLRRMIGVALIGVIVVGAGAWIARTPRADHDRIGGITRSRIGVKSTPAGGDKFGIAQSTWQTVAVALLTVVLVTTYRARRRPSVRDMDRLAEDL